MSASSRDPDHTTLPSSMNTSVSATRERVLRVLLDQQHRAPAVAQLEDGVHHRLRRERREAERGLVGDQHDRRVGERGCEAQHLLLAAREQPGHLLAALAQDREALVGVLARSCSSRRSTVRFSSTVRPGKMPRASGTSRTPARARRNGSVVGDLRRPRGRPPRARPRRCPPRPTHSVDLPAPLAPSSAVTLPALDAAGRRRAAPRRRRSPRRCRAPRTRRRRRPASEICAGGAVSAAGRVLGAPRSCSGTSPPCDLGLGFGDAAPARAFSRFLRSFCWPASARMPSGSWASWIAPRPDRIGTK